MIIRSALLSLLACALIGAQALLAHQLGVKPERSEQRREFVIEFVNKERVAFSPVDLSDGLITFKAQVNGVPVIGILDTGSSVTLVDSSLIEAEVDAGNRGSIEFEASNSAIEASTAPDTIIEIDRQLLLSGDFLSADLVSFRKATGLDIKLIVGTDVLGNTSLLLNAPNERMFFAPSGKLNFNRSGWRSLPMDDAVVSASIMNTQVLLKIDTGSNAPLAIRAKSWSKIFGNAPLEELFDSVDVSGARVSNKKV